MKKYISIIYGLILISASNLTAQYTATYSTSVTAAIVDTPKVVSEQERFYELGDFYIGPQPDEDELEWFANNGVTLVLNTRTDSEIEEHTDEEYDEAELAEELGMTYMHLPLGGEAGYSPEDVDSLAKYLMTSEKKTLVHCLVGIRAAYLMVAYLIKFMDVPIDDAVEIGKKMKMQIPFEDMLGFPITRSKLEE
jgi:uncharacterized protein (TIGR01244 family)